MCVFAGMWEVDSRMMAIKTEFSFTFVSLENNIPALVSPLIFKYFFSYNHILWLCGGFAN